MGRFYQTGRDGSAKVWNGGIVRVSRCIRDPRIPRHTPPRDRRIQKTIRRPTGHSLDVRLSSPRYGFHRIHAFQAYDLNHSSTSPGRAILTDSPKSPGEGHMDAE